MVKIQTHILSAQFVHRLVFRIELGQYCVNFAQYLMCSDLEHIQGLMLNFQVEMIPRSMKMKCGRLPKNIQWKSMIMICAACAQITTRCTNQKSIPIPGVIVLCLMKTLFVFCKSIFIT